MRELTVEEVKQVAGGLKSTMGWPYGPGGGGSGGEGDGSGYRFLGVTETNFFEGMFVILGGFVGNVVGGPPGAIIGGGIGGMVGQSVHYYAEGLHATPSPYVIAHLGRAA